VGNDFQEKVLGGHRFLAYVVSIHLFIEGWLQEWLRAALPNGKVLFGDRPPSYHQLVLFCQAQGLISDELASVLQKVNAFRNRFAHTKKYQPTSAEISDFMRAVARVQPSFYAAPQQATEDEFGEALAAVCGHIDRLVSEFKRAHKEPLR
jgi:hypothetical protein